MFSHGACFKVTVGIEMVHLQIVEAVIKERVIELDLTQKQGNSPMSAVIRPLP